MFIKFNSAWLLQPLQPHVGAHELLDDYFYTNVSLQGAIMTAVFEIMNSYCYFINN